MERKLASIQRVISVEPIPNADAIEKTTVLGWHLVTKKDEVKPGELVVFFEVDSILPKQPVFSFLEKCNYRIKTIRLRGQVSQGLVLPVSCIDFADLSNAKEGDDVTELLKVQKWEPQLPESHACLGGKIKGLFPSFLKKTDEIRIQSCPKILERHKGKVFVYTEKLDGSSITIYLRNNEFGVCSRNLELKRDADSFDEIRNAFWKAVVANNVEQKMRDFGRDNIAIQGELIGPGIQKNKYHLNDFDLYFYNVWDIATHSYIQTHKEYIDIIKGMGLKTVPILGEVELNHTVDELVQMSIGYSVLDKVFREGIVFRPLVEDTDNDLGRLSFKVINPEFLLKHGE